MLTQAVRCSSHEMNPIVITKANLFFCLALNKKQRKRYEKKLAARTAVLPPKIPAHHNAHDIVPASYNRDSLPEDVMLDATEGQAKRSEVTQSAREARRKAIKESNFLRGL